MTPLTAPILALFDAGSSPSQIAHKLDTSLSTVYPVLRHHRPNRARAPRPKGSDKERLVRGLLSLGHKPRRVAELARCSRAWVYRIQKET